MIVSEFESQESADESRKDFADMTFTHSNGRIYVGTIHMKDGEPYDGSGRKLTMTKTN